jgi:hypothetical protein
MPYDRPNVKETINYRKIQKIFVPLLTAKRDIHEWILFVLTFKHANGMAVSLHYPGPSDPIISNEFKKRCPQLITGVY